MTAGQQPQDSRTKLNRETSRIAWKELQPQFARGVALAVADDLDLIEVAFQVAQDNALLIGEWMAAGKFGRVSDEQAGVWVTGEAELWAVVVSPWVLVQQVRK